MRIAAHLGIHLSPSSSSLTPTSRHLGVDTTGLESEESEASNSEGGDNLRSEGGTPSRDKTATVDGVGSNDPDTSGSKSD